MRDTFRSGFGAVVGRIVRTGTDQHFLVANAGERLYNGAMEETSFCCFCGRRLSRDFYYCPYCGTIYRDKPRLIARTSGRDALLSTRIARLESSLSSLELEIEELLEAGS